MLNRLFNNRKKSEANTQQKIEEGTIPAPIVSSTSVISKTVFESEMDPEFLVAAKTSPIQHDFPENDIEAVFSDVPKPKNVNPNPVKETELYDSLFETDLLSQSMESREIPVVTSTSTVSKFKPSKTVLNPSKEVENKELEETIFSGDYQSHSFTSSNKYIDLDQPISFHESMQMPSDEFVGGQHLDEKEPINTEKTANTDPIDEDTKKKISITDSSHHQNSLTKPKRKKIEIDNAPKQKREPEDGDGQSYPFKDALTTTLSEYINIVTEKKIDLSDEKNLRNSIVDVNMFFEQLQNPGIDDEEAKELAIAFTTEVSRRYRLLTLILVRLIQVYIPTKDFVNSMTKNIDFYLVKIKGHLHKYHLMQVYQNGKIQKEYLEEIMLQTMDFNTGLVKDVHPEKPSANADKDEEKEFWKKFDAKLLSFESQKLAKFLYHLNNEAQHFVSKDEGINRAYNLMARLVLSSDRDAIKLIHNFILRDFGGSVYLRKQLEDAYCTFYGYGDPKKPIVNLHFLFEDTIQQYLFLFKKNKENDLSDEGVRRARTLLKSCEKSEAELLQDCLGFLREEKSSRLRLMVAKDICIYLNITHQKFQEKMRGDGQHTPLEVDVRIGLIREECKLRTGMSSKAAVNMTKEGKSLAEVYKERSIIDLSHVKVPERPKISPIASVLDVAPLWISPRHDQKKAASDPFDSYQNLRGSDSQMQLNNAENPIQRVDIDNPFDGGPRPSSR